MHIEDAIASLTSLLGERLVRSKSDLDLHGRSESHFPPAPPDAVAYPESTAEVAGIVGICARHRVPLVHLSTDLVWSGATPPYREASPAVPLSLYGWTKLMGDVLLLRRCPEALVARTSVVFGPAPSKASTFSEAVLAGEVPAFFTDSWRNHTPVGWLAETLLDLAERSASGLLLVSARWEQTRSAFAEALLEHVGRDAPDLPLAYRPPRVPETLALRPERLERVLGQSAPDLHESLEMEYPR